MDQLSGSRGRALWYALPCVLCLLLYWRGFTAWFRADDFAWLGTGIYINNLHDLSSLRSLMTFQTQPPSKAPHVDAP